MILRNDSAFYLSIIKFWLRKIKFSASNTEIQSHVRMSDKLENTCYVYLAQT
jgi:hypothetical protein